MSVWKAYISSVTTAQGHTQTPLHTVSHKCTHTNLIPSLILLQFCVCITAPKHLLSPRCEWMQALAASCGQARMRLMHTPWFQITLKAALLGGMGWYLDCNFLWGFITDRDMHPIIQIQPKPNNNPSDNNSMNRWNQGHWCSPTNCHQSDTKQKQKKAELWQALWRKWRPLWRIIKSPRLNWSMNDYNYLPFPKTKMAHSSAGQNVTCA